jgi:hypothetical protein
MIIQQNAVLFLPHFFRNVSDLPCSPPLFGSGCCVHILIQSYQGLAMNGQNGTPVVIIPIEDWSQKKQKTYNTGDSPAVTDLSTNPALLSLSRAERTGCRVL